MVFTANHLTDTDKQNSTGKYRQTNSIQIRKVNNLKYSKTKLPGSVAFYNTRPGNEVGLFYNAPEPTRGDGVLRCSGISWTICKQSEPCSRQITTSTPDHSIFYRLDALSDAPTNSVKELKARLIFSYSVTFRVLH